MQLWVNESFSAGSCCSKCVTPQSMFKDRHEERSDELRTPSRCNENFEQKCNGFKRVCELKTNFFNNTKISQVIYIMTFSKAVLCTL